MISPGTDRVSKCIVESSIRYESPAKVDYREKAIRAAIGRRDISRMRILFFLGSTPYEYLYLRSLGARPENLFPIDMMESYCAKVSRYLAKIGEPGTIYNGDFNRVAPMLAEQHGGFDLIHLDTCFALARKSLIPLIETTFKPGVLAKHGRLIVNFVGLRDTAFLRDFKNSTLYNMLMFGYETNYPEFVRTYPRKSDFMLAIQNDFRDSKLESIVTDHATPRRIKRLACGTYRTNVNPMRWQAYKVDS